MFHMQTLPGWGGVLLYPFPALLTLPQLWETTYGLSGPTNLFHLFLLAADANTLEGLLGVICVPALLLICLLGLDMCKGVTCGGPE